MTAGDRPRQVADEDSLDRATCGRIPRCHYETAQPVAARAVTRHPLSQRWPPPAGTLRGQLPALRPAGWAIPAAVTVLAFGLLLGVALTSITAPPAPVVAVGGLGLLGLLSLAIASYDAAVVFGIALLGVVLVEPAPPDAVLAAAILVALLTNRLDLGRVPAWVALLLGALLGLNAMSLANAVDFSSAGRFMATTVFVVVLADWLAGYVDSARRAKGVALAYLGAALFSAALGIAALLVPIPGRGTLLYHGCCRAQALFKDPNVFGPFLVPAIVILLEELLTPRLFAGRQGMKMAAIVLLCIGVLVSYSRAAWLDLVVALIVSPALVLVLRRGGGRPAAALLATVVLLAGAAGAYLATTGSEGFLRERATFQAYDTSRFSAQPGRHPACGGPSARCRTRVSSTCASRSPRTASTCASWPSRACSDSSCWPGCSSAPSRWRSTTPSQERSTYGIGSAALLAAWCGLLSNSFFVDTLHWRHLWVIAALIWAAAMRSYRSALT